MRIPKPQNIFIALGLIAVVGMAFWSPLSTSRISSEPAALSDIVRANQKLSDGTLQVPDDGVVLKNGTVLDQIVSIGRYGDILIDDGGDNSYQIVWLPRSEKYFLFIQHKPYEENRKRAEIAFLTAVAKNSKEIACRMPVEVAPASWVEDRAPERLSYCD